MSKDKRIKLGVVGVDSGRLLVCDPCYIDDEWIEHGFDSKEMYEDTETGEKIISPRRRLSEGITFASEYKDGMTYNEAVQKGILKAIPQPETGEFSYDGCCKSGQLNFKRGHAGAGVAFRSGDGVYEVIATMDGVGERIKKVEIILISEADGGDRCENCGHDKWDHESEVLNTDDDTVFMRCEVEGCNCSSYEYDI